MIAAFMLSTFSVVSLSSSVGSSAISTSSKLTSSAFRFLRKLMARFITICLSHKPKVDSCLKSAMRLKASKKASCNTSSASASSFTIRKATLYIAFAYSLYSSNCAFLLPDRQSSTSARCLSIYTVSKFICVLVNRHPIF
ncbi:hypothetical protein D9M68_624980 [compost metagenome]